MGARWVPDQSMLGQVRFYLRFAETYRCVELARLLVESKAATRETVEVHSSFSANNH